MNTRTGQVRKPSKPGATGRRPYAMEGRPHRGRPMAPSEGRRTSGRQQRPSSEGTPIPWEAQVGWPGLAVSHRLREEQFSATVTAALAGRRHGARVGKAGTEPPAGRLPRTRGDEPWEEAGWNRTSTRGVRTERGGRRATHLFAWVYRTISATVYILMHNFRQDWTGRIQPCLDVRRLGARSWVGSSTWTSYRPRMGLRLVLPVPLVVRRIVVSCHVRPAGAGRPATRCHGTSPPARRPRTPASAS